MRITAINGLTSERGSGGELAPILFGQFEKVELLLRPEVQTFDTFGYLGYIDYCDTTQTQRITARTTHDFVYPEGYRKILDPGGVNNEPVPEDEPTDPDAPEKTEEEIAAEEEAARIERERKAAELEAAQVLEDRHRVILYFSAVIDYGVISSEFLSQIDVLQTSFPSFVGLGDDGSGRLVIANPNFTAPKGITKNTDTQLQFVIDTVNEAGAIERVESTFTVFPKIFESLKNVKVFNNYRVQLPVSVETIEYQGDFEAIEINRGMSFEYSEYHTGPRKTTLLNNLLAQPRGGKPVFVENCYSTHTHRDDPRYITIEELPNTRDFFSVERLKVLTHSFDIPLYFTNTNVEKEDPLPLGPDYSQAKELKVLALTRLYPEATGVYFYGSKLFYWPIPNGVEIVQGTHTAPEDIIGEPERVGTYGDYLATVNVIPRKTKDDLPLAPETQMIADPLPESVREVYDYFHGLNLLYTNGTNFKYPRLPEGVIAVRDYFTMDCNERGSDGLVIPGLPSTVKYIKGYCKDILNSDLDYILNEDTSAPVIQLRQINNLELEPNLCNNVESVEDWMTGAFEGSNVDLLHNTDKLIRPVPNLSPTGKTLNSFNKAFKIISNVVLRVPSDELDNSGETVKWDYVYTENRNLSIEALLPYLSNLSDPSVHENSYREAFNGNYQGAAEDLISLSSVDTPQSVIAIEDGYQSFNSYPNSTPPLTDEEARARQDGAARSGRVLTWQGQPITADYTPF